MCVHNGLAVNGKPKICFRKHIQWKIELVTHTNTPWHVLVRNRLTFNSNTSRQWYFQDLWESCFMLCTSSQSLYIHTFKFIRFIVLMFCPGQSSKCKIEKGNNFKLRTERVTVIMNYLVGSISIQSFKLIAFIVLKKCSRTKFKEN